MGKVIIIFSKVFTTEGIGSFGSPVEIVEEGEEIKAELTPGLLLAVVENVSVHHANRIIHDLRPVSWPMKEPEKEKRLGSLTHRTGRSLSDICYGTVPPQMVEEQRDI